MADMSPDLTNRMNGLVFNIDELAKVLQLEPGINETFCYREVCKVRGMLVMDVESNFGYKLRPVEYVATPVMTPEPVVATPEPRPRTDEERALADSKSASVAETVVTFSAAGLPAAKPKAKAKPKVKK